MRQRLSQALLESPAWKTVFLVLETIAAGVLSGAFIAEITEKGQLNWWLFSKVRSFYALVVLTVLMFLHNRCIYKHDRDVIKFSDRDFCVAYMRSKCLPEAADRYRELIRTGEVGELTRAMEEIRNILE